MTPRTILITLGLLVAILLALYALGFFRVGEDLAPGRQPPMGGASQPPLSGGGSGR